MVLRGAKINAYTHLAGTIEGTTTRLFLNGPNDPIAEVEPYLDKNTYMEIELTLGANETSEISVKDIYLMSGTFSQRHCTLHW